MSFHIKFYWYDVVVAVRQQGGKGVLVGPRRIRDGRVTYASFIRESEGIKVHGNTVIVMGKEIVVPKGNSPQAGKTINPRYTNTSMKRDGQWRLIARHASVLQSLNFSFPKGKQLNVNWNEQSTGKWCPGSSESLIFPQIKISCLQS